MVLMAKSIVLVMIAVGMRKTLQRAISHIDSFSADKHDSKLLVGGLESWLQFLFIVTEAVSAHTTREATNLAHVSPVGCR